MKLTSRNKFKLIFVAVIIKILFLILFAYLRDSDSINNCRFYSISGDFSDYVEPVNQYIENDQNLFLNDRLTVRMPGYSLVYLLFRLFFSEHWALNIITFLQAILSGISCYCLAQIAFSMFNNIYIYWLTYFGYIISTYVSIWDGYILTESFGASSLIISVFLLSCYLQNKKTIFLLCSGIFIAWCIFLRPYILPVLFMLSLIIILVSPLKMLKKTLIIFISPFLLAESVWIIRNYIVTNKLILFQSRLTDQGNINSLDKPAHLTFATFVTKFGGDDVYWQVNSESMWFMPDTFQRKFGGRLSDENIFPKQIFEDTLTFEHILAARKYFFKTYDTSITVNEKLFYNREANKITLAFMNSYERRHFFMFHFASRLIQLKKFIFHPGTYSLPIGLFSQITLPWKIIKLFYSILYLFVMIVGVFASLYKVLFSAKEIKSKIAIIIYALIPLYLVTVFPLLFRTFEYRFNTFAYIFLLIFSCQFTVDLFIKFGLLKKTR